MASPIGLESLGTPLLTGQEGGSENPETEAKICAVCHGVFKDDAAQIGIPVDDSNNRESNEAIEAGDRAEERVYRRNECLTRSVYAMIVVAIFSIIGRVVSQYNR